MGADSSASFTSNIIMSFVSTLTMFSRVMITLVACSIRLDSAAGRFRDLLLVLVLNVLVVLVIGVIVVMRWLSLFWLTIVVVVVDFFTESRNPTGGLCCRCWNFDVVLLVLLLVLVWFFSREYIVSRFTFINNKELIKVIVKRFIVIRLD